MRLNSERIYHDPLHGAIALDATDPVEALLIQLIDTPAFQRLRRIRQLGPASLTFHGAESSRFTHSLGVMAIARRAFDRLCKWSPGLRPYRAVVLTAALLHDIGHGPFSHTAEEIFGSHHELWTARILQESAPIRERLQAHHPDLLPQILQVYAHSHPVPLVWQLVSSQLDCDRLDYLMRDSYFTGTSYGRIDLERILTALETDPHTQQLVVAHKGLSAVEHYLIVRCFMYAQVYNHPKNIAATWTLEQAFNRARELVQAGQLQPDATVQAWLLENCDRLPLADYLAADDGVFLYHLQRWQHHPDPILADLSRRYCDRDLCKCLDISHLTSDHRQALLRATHTHLTAAGFHAPYYSGIRIFFSRGYRLYQKGIQIRTAHGLVDINTLSPLVQTLIQSHERAWLIYPREVESGVRSQLPPA